MIRTAEQRPQQINDKQSNNEEQFKGKNETADKQTKPQQKQKRSTEFIPLSKVFPFTLTEFALALKVRGIG